MIEYEAFPRRLEVSDRREDAKDGLFEDLVSGLENGMVFGGGVGRWLGMVIKRERKTMDEDTQRFPSVTLHKGIPSIEDR
jgi:uncharacterized protein YggL (DUF469 family)